MAQEQQRTEHTLYTLALSLNQVQVWQAFLDQAELEFEYLQSLLSPDERERADRFHFDRDRRRFTVGRGILRLVLSNYLETLPQDIQFQYGTHGKPAICAALNPAGFCFNVSHSEDLALYAIAQQRSVGIDVELIRPLADLELCAEQVFSVQERAAFDALPYSQKLTAFFNAWTQKEAYVKANGAGLSLPLDQIIISFNSIGSARLMLAETHLNPVQSWFVHTFVPYQGYVAALVLHPLGIRPD